MFSTDHIIKHRSKKDVFHLYLLGDEHVGTIHHTAKQFRKKVKEIQEDEKALWIGMGDVGEFITPRDKRWDEGSIADWVERDNIGSSQVNYAYEVLSPIKDKCVGLLYGNHEDSIRRYNHQNVHKDLCDKLGVKNLGFSCFIHFVFKIAGTSSTHLIKGFFSHGSGNAITRGGKLNKLERFMSEFEADIYGYAHVHDVITTSKHPLTTNKLKEIIHRPKVGAMSGCWFRTYTKGVYASYGERKLYPPTTIGCPKFIINPTEVKIKVENTD